TDDSIGASSNSSMPGTVFKNNIFTRSVKIAGNASEANNLYADADARFADAADGDFTLKSSSPAIDRGATISPYTNGYAGAAPDMGALEYSKPAFSAGADLSIRTPVVPPPLKSPGGGSGGSGGGSGSGSDPGSGT